MFANVGIQYRQNHGRLTVLQKLLTVKNASYSKSTIKCMTLLTAHNFNTSMHPLYADTIFIMIELIRQIIVFKILNAHYYTMIIYDIYGKCYRAVMHHNTCKMSFNKKNIIFRGVYSFVTVFAMLSNKEQIEERSQIKS